MQTQSITASQPKFLDLPGLLTPLKSRGYAAGKIHIINLRAFVSADTSIDDVREEMKLTEIIGTRSNGRLGGHGWDVSNRQEMWVSEALLNGGKSNVLLYR